MPLNDTIRDVPQSQSEGVARRLLGNDLADRYGDVIGVRKTTAADVLRDFTVGLQQGPGKVTELHTQVQEQFQKSYDRAATRALEEKKFDISKASAFLDAIKTVQGLPPGHRAAILKDTLDQAGIPYSAAAIKMFTDSDLVGKLPLNDLSARAADGTLDTNTISGIMGSGLNAAKFVSESVRRDGDEKRTGKMILDAESQRVRIRGLRQKLKTDASLAPVQLRNAQLLGDVREKALKGGGITGVPEIDEALRTAVAGGSAPSTARRAPIAPVGLPQRPLTGVGVTGGAAAGAAFTPGAAEPAPDPSAPAPPAPGTDVSAAKQRLGLQ